MTGRYPQPALTADYSRAAIGLALTLGPFLLVRPHWVVALTLGLLGLVFAAFLVRTLHRQFQRFTVDDTGIMRHGPLGRALRWDQVARVDLAYFSTRRDKTEGWFHLTLRGAGRRIDMDSTLDGFDRIAAAVADQVRDRAIAVDDTTKENFIALGHGVTPRPQAPWRR